MNKGGALRQSVREYYENLKKDNKDITMDKSENKAKQQPVSQKIIKRLKVANALSVPPGEYARKCETQRN